MTEKKLDLLIIGGGITGAGIALDAALRGLQVGLVEMNDFAFGTSSRSTKLVHGGLRYLKQLEFGIVAETGRERAIVYENAPHVTTPEKMMLPFYKGGTFGKLSTSIGLKLYDFLAQVKKSERRFMLNREATLTREPLLKEEGLIGSGIYVEYKTDDARLTIEVIKKAVEIGAVAVNYAKAEDFIYEHGNLIGAKVKDVLSQKMYSLFAKKIINAAGPWVDQLREQDHSKKRKHLLITKGVHVLFDQKRFPLHHAVYFDHTDGRMIFAIPRDGKVYVGTTDTVYHGDFRYPRMTAEDRNYLLEAVNQMFPTLKLTGEDIEASWAGLRPLVHEEGKSPSEVSRKDEIFFSQSGLISIAGGKLTGYRKMAERVVDVVMKQLQKAENKSFVTSTTKEIRLSGGEVGGAKGFPIFMQEKLEEGKKLGLQSEEAKQLIQRYGSNINHIYHRMSRLQDCMHPLPPAVIASINYSLEEEMVVTPIDFFLRRTGTLLFDRSWVLRWKESVINYMADYFQWDDEQKQALTDDLDRELFYSIHPAEQE